MLEVRRQLASLRGVDGLDWPVHGFVITHPGGAVLVDTGVGGPQELLDDWRVVNGSAADALAELDMTPADIWLVINTHLHFDHCGQNAVFPHAPFYVQRAELTARRREQPELAAGSASWARGSNCWTGTPGAARPVGHRNPGHTAGHQCVTVNTGDGSPDILIGDAAYTPREYTGPLDRSATRQAATGPLAGLTARIHSVGPAGVHSATTPASCTPSDGAGPSPAGTGPCGATGAGRSGPARRPRRRRRRR